MFITALMSADKMGARALCLALCLVLLCPSLLLAQFLDNYQYGAPAGCTWGTHAAPVPGQCGTYQCLSRWFPGFSYPAQCPYGTLFSMRAGRCISPLTLAAQCSPVAAQNAYFWSWF